MNVDLNIIFFAEKYHTVVNSFLREASLFFDKMIIRKKRKKYFGKSGAGKFVCQNKIFLLNTLYLKKYTAMINTYQYI